MKFGHRVPIPNFITSAISFVDYGMKMAVLILFRANATSMIISHWPLLVRETTGYAGGGTP